MRVTFLNPVGAIGGAERVLLATMRCVREHRPRAALRLVQLAPGPLASEAEALGARVDVVALPEELAGLGDSQLRCYNHLQALSHLVGPTLRAAPALAHFLRAWSAAVRRGDPQLIHSNGLKTHLLAALAGWRGVPIVWHLHDFYAQRPFAGRMLSRISPGVSAGVAISCAIRRDAERIIDASRLFLVPNAVDTAHFSPGRGDGEALDRAAGLPVGGIDTVRVGLVATYGIWKGHDVFLDALAAAPPQVRGYIVGGPIYSTAGSQWTRSELELRVATNRLRGRVGFIPFQAEPVCVYRALDIVVHASTRPEPFGLTIAEAMSCGKPVIVASGGGAAELFTDGVDALGHAPGDVKGLSAAITRLAGDPTLRDRLGASARLRAVERFGLDRYAAELLSIYERLISVPQQPERHLRLR